MHWYINDASLCGQYPDAVTFVDHLSKLLNARTSVPVLADKLFCSRTLHTRPVTSDMDFRSAITLLPKKIPLQLVLAWLTKQGPFWDEMREFIADDYFEFNGKDVTDFGIAEAARRLLIRYRATSFSFPGGGFDFSPVAIQHGLPESPFGTINVPNIWNLDELVRHAQSFLPSPTNWAQMLMHAQSRFDGLIISSAAVDILNKEPFSRAVVERVFSLFSVLQEFVTCRKVDGTYSDRNFELINTHFSGDKAWFTDESDSNKNNFREDMTFMDKANNERVFCPWHGKIKTPQYRIHFEWPVPQGSKIRVFYIGPKITKK